MCEPCLERLFAKIQMPAVFTACWVWIGAKGQGYGHFTPAHGGTRQAHRVTYELGVGPIPRGLQIDHLCRNHSCVNPLHLEPVTARENTRRGFSPSGLNARKTSCPAGHPYQQRRNGPRRCAQCDRQAQALVIGREIRPRYPLSPMCGKGHLLDAVNTYIRKDGGRQCRACDTDRKRVSRAEGRSR